MGIELGGSGWLYSSVAPPSSINVSVSGWLRTVQPLPDFSSYYILTTGSKYIGTGVDTTNRVRLFSDSGENRFTPPRTPNDTWMYFCIACQGIGNFDFLGRYWGINTPLDIGTTQLNGEDFTPNDFIIGADTILGGGTLAELKIAYLKVWNRFLTLEEFQDESKVITPVNYDDLWAYYPLWSPNDTNDYSGNGNHLTIGGSVSYVAPPPIEWGYAPPIVIPGEVSVGPPPPESIADVDHTADDAVLSSLVSVLEQRLLDLSSTSDDATLSSSVSVVEDGQVVITVLHTADDAILASIIETIAETEIIHTADDAILSSSVSVVEDGQVVITVLHTADDAVSSAFIETTKEIDVDHTADDAALSSFVTVSEEDTRTLNLISTSEDGVLSSDIITEREINVPHVADDAALSSFVTVIEDGVRSANAIHTADDATLNSFVSTGIIVGIIVASYRVYKAQTGIQAYKVRMSVKGSS